MQIPKETLRSEEPDRRCKNDAYVADADVWKSRKECVDMSPARVFLHQHLRAILYVLRDFATGARNLVCTSGFIFGAHRNTDLLFCYGNSQHRQTACRRCHKQEFHDDAVKQWPCPEHGFPK